MWKDSWRKRASIGDSSAAIASLSRCLKALDHQVEGITKKTWRRVNFIQVSVAAVLTPQNPQCAYQRYQNQWKAHGHIALVMNTPWDVLVVKILPINSPCPSHASPPPLPTPHRKPSLYGEGYGSFGPAQPFCALPNLLTIGYQYSAI